MHFLGNQTGRLFWIRWSILFLSSPSGEQSRCSRNFVIVFIDRTKFGVVLRICLIPCKKSHRHRHRVFDCVNTWFSGLNWMWMQNGTTEEVKKIVSTLNEAQVPSQDVVGKWNEFWVLICVALTREWYLKEKEAVTQVSVYSQNCFCFILYMLYEIMLLFLHRFEVRAYVQVE
jgi:hypothetical protein